ncbi:putative cadherin [Schistosoma mansoni]|uniref:putative cadherin n=1 Tax=Schistosoma mansoni TaxID=6183 RepID=UPI00022DC4C7|nr:putative cadherin [Schistosoma mansoni]|eukprot:XP_018651768.1 putative cadherin [Schistosoma mansoni]
MPLNHYYYNFFKFWILLHNCTYLLYFCDGCQSIANIKITEYSTEQYLNQSNFNVIHSSWPINPIHSQISINLSEILLQNLHLSIEDINEPLYFSDVEQSEPFIIRRRVSDDHSKFSWYELTSIIPVNRETICDIKRYPERITISSKGTYFLRIDINDLNDNAPKFQELIFGKSLINKHDNYGRFIINIMENTPNGRWIPLPKATDLDEGLNAYVQYSIKLPNNEPVWNDYFKLIDNVQNSNIDTMSIPTKVYLNTDTNEFSALATDYNGPGLLILKTLDREEISSFLFILIATDMGQPFPRSSSLNIWLRILDENDNPPVFQKSEFHIEVNENKAGIPLLNIHVNDSDIDSNARLNYYLRTVNGMNQVSPEYLRNHIQLLPSVEGVSLRISQPLDYELQSHFIFEIVCVDQGHPPLSASAQIKITVLNMNDNAPIIKFYHHGQPLDSNYAQISIYENEFSNYSKENQILCHVHVTDLDNDLSSIQCSLEGDKSKQFELKEVSTNRLVQKRKIFDLITIVLLDREVVPQHTLIVKCQDGTTESSLVGRNQLHIIVKDRNDNAPKFTQEHYIGHVKENTANTVVTLINSNAETVVNSYRNVIHATDLDIGSNAQVAYSLKSLYLPDYIKFVQNHTKENEQSLLLFLKNQTQSITISNDHDLMHNSTGEIVEHQTKRSISHDTQKDVENFYIDPISGQLRTRTELDCEQQNVYYFAVIAIDQAVPSEKRHSTTALVTVIVDDVNDNPPVLEQHHYIFDISEGLPRHSLIGQIKSTDADRDKENRYITYELRDVVNINASNFIYVEQNTGIIYSRKILDREEIQQIPFIIIARNEKPKSKLSSIHLNRTTFYDEASVTINIIDQNDNAPIMLHHGEILKYNGGTEGGLHSQTKQLQQLSVVDLKYNINVKDPFNSCIEFPYYFADADEKENAQIDVTLETNPYFEFRLDHTIICKISKEDPPVGQYTVHVVARDRPTDPTKSLKRRYAVRIHIVNEQVSTIESQTNLLKNIDFDSPPVSGDTHPTKWLQPVRLNGKDKKDLDFEKRYPKIIPSTNNAYQSYQSTSVLDESQQRYGLSTIAIVAALISVAGLLCLLLIGVVIAMKRIVPRTHNEVPVPLQKNNDKETDRSGISVWNMTSYPSPEYTLDMETGKIIEHHLGRPAGKYPNHSSDKSFGSDSANHLCHPSYLSTTHPLDISAQRFSPVSISSLYGSVKYMTQPLKIPTTFKTTTRQIPKDISVCDGSQIELTTKNNSTLSKSCDELRIVTGPMNNSCVQNQTTPSYEEQIALNTDHLYAMKCQTIKSKYQELNNKQNNNLISNEYNNQLNDKNEQRIWLLSNHKHDIKNNKPGILISPDDISDYQILEHMKYPSILRKSECYEIMPNSPKNNNNNANFNNLLHEQQDHSKITQKLTGYNNQSTTLLSAHSLKCLNVQKSFV